MLRVTRCHNTGQLWVDIGNYSIKIGADERFGDRAVKLRGLPDLAKKRKGKEINLVAKVKPL